MALQLSVNRTVRLAAHATGFAPLANAPSSAFATLNLAITGDEGDDLRLCLFLKGYNAPLAGKLADAINAALAEHAASLNLREAA
jgi:hypothetical protein